MSRIFYLLILMNIPSLGYSQMLSNVNFDEIKVNVANASSPFYYPNLINRIVSRDTSLNSEEYKHLYYGNVFQEYYYPYGATELQKQFDETFSSSIANFEEKEKIGLKLIAENPVNLETYLKMIYLYNSMKMQGEATVFAKIYVSFLEVIYASGGGKTCDNGFVVISVDDEYRIAGDLGLTVVRQSLVASCDWLIFSKKGQKRKNRIRSLYFNVRMPLTYLSKSFDQSDLPEADPTLDEKIED